MPTLNAASRERVAFGGALFALVFYVHNYALRQPPAAAPSAASAAGGGGDGDGNSVGFPVDYVPRSARTEPDGHANLLEENDGIFNEGNCGTWHHAPGRLEWNCRLEWDEWMLSNAFVMPGDVVIEFGARYGTTSCILSRDVGEDGHVIAVEPDPLVHGYLLRNRYEHGCNYHAVLGTVSNEPLFKGRDSGYAGQTTSTGKGRGLPRASVEDIEGLVGRRINVALIDCEGCIQFVDTTGLLDEIKGVDLILMEEDGLKSYSEWHSKLRGRKYKCLWYVRDTFHRTDKLASWSVTMRHSAWAHERVLGGGGIVGGEKRKLPPSCEEYAKAHGFDATRIDCAECPV